MKMKSICPLEGDGRMLPNVLCVTSLLQRAECFLTTPKMSYEICYP